MSGIKSILQSKMVLFNSAIVAVVSVLKHFGIDFPKDLVMEIVGLINIMLRLVTNTPISGEQKTETTETTEGP